MVGKLIATLGKRQHWVQGFAALLLFGSGLVVGSAGTFAVLKEKIQVGRVPIRDAGFVDFLIRDWQPKYELDDQQVEQIRDVMIDQAKAFREIFQAAEKQTQALEKPWLAKMKEILTAEQYAQWLEDYEGHKQRRDRRGPGNKRGRRDEDRQGRDGRGGPPREGREGLGGPPPEGRFGPPPDRERGPDGPPPESTEGSSTPADANESAL